MPLPTRQTQFLRVEIRSEVASLNTLQAETAAEIDALVPAILDRAFRGSYFNETTASDGRKRSVMLVEEQTIDDVMRGVLIRLLDLPPDVQATRGRFSEVVGVMLRLENPKARLSLTETRGKPFSALGELLWYLSRSNDLAFIEFYLKQYREESDDGQTVYSGYGPRLFNMRDAHNQIANIIALLKAKPSSRRAVIQIFDSADIAADHKEVPCTCTLQFLLRHDRLHMFTSMRSNDAFLGLPHDVFALTMIQEILARSLSVEPGTYSHAVGSLHL